MPGQKQRIFRRFEKEAKIKHKELEKAGLTCTCGKCCLVKFSLDEVRVIIDMKDMDEIIACSGEKGK